MALRVSSISPYADEERKAESGEDNNADIRRRTNTNNAIIIGARDDSVSAAAANNNNTTKSSTDTVTVGNCGKASGFANSSGDDSNPSTPRPPRVGGGGRQRQRLEPREECIETNYLLPNGQDLEALTCFFTPPLKPRRFHQRQQQRSTDQLTRKSHHASLRIGIKAPMMMTRIGEIRFEVPKSGSMQYLSRTFYLPAEPTACSLGSLNPDLYNNPEEGDISEYPDNHVGRLWFSMEHDKETEKLTVVVVKARNLSNREATVGNANTATICDTFVRLYLLPDERRHMDTKVKRKAANPNYGDSITFDVAQDSLSERTLRLIVIDTDLLKRQLPIGAVEFPLTDYVRCKRPKLTVWRDLRKDLAQDISQLGEVHCSLSYNPTLQRLAIVLIEAKNLLLPVGVQQNEIDTFGKVTLSIGPKLVKTKKTRVVKKTDSPVFNEAFDFNKIAQDKLEQICLGVQIMLAKPERQLGRLTLAGPMFARGQQLTHWQEMIAQPKETVANWHYLSE